MKIDVKEEVKHRVTVTISRDAWNDIVAIIAKSKGVSDVIVFNAITRVGSAYKKRLVYIPHMLDARRKAIVDTITAIGIRDFIEVSPYHDPKATHRCYARYFTTDGKIAHAPVVVVVNS